MQKKRKVPLRKCVACQESKPKRALVRIVKTPEDAIIVDFTGKQSGRGAYLCNNDDCLSTAKKTRALERALKHAVSEDVYEQLKQTLTRQAGEQHD